jgi:hypothetical protein
MTSLASSESILEYRRSLDSESDARGIDQPDAEELRHGGRSSIPRSARVGVGRRTSTGGERQ